MSLPSRYMYEITVPCEEQVRKAIEIVFFVGCVQEIKKIRENGAQPATFQVETIEINFEGNHDIQERDLIKDRNDVIVTVDGSEYRLDFCWITQ